MSNVKVLADAYARSKSGELREITLLSRAYEEGYNAGKAFIEETKAASVYIPDVPAQAVKNDGEDVEVYFKTDVELPKPPFPFIPKEEPQPETFVEPTPAPLEPSTETQTEVGGQPAEQQEQGTGLATDFPEFNGEERAQ